MASGYTTTDALADSIHVIVAGARIVREYEGVMPQLVDKTTLMDEVVDWREITLAKLNAQDVTETTDLDNAQQITDSVITLTPNMVGIYTVITDKVARSISKKTLAKHGALAQNAIERKKDLAGLAVLDSATTSLSGAGTTLVSSVIAHGGVRITSNTTEPGVAPIRCVLHGFQITDLYDEHTAGVGTYPVPEGMTARVFTEGFKMRIGGVDIFQDDNLTIDSSSDAKGGIFAAAAIPFVQGMKPKVEVVRKPNLGGGATGVYHYDEYVYGERSAGNWLFEVYSDATSPA